MYVQKRNAYIAIPNTCTSRYGSENLIFQRSYVDIHKKHARRSSQPHVILSMKYIAVFFVKQHTCRVDQNDGTCI